MNGVQKITSWLPARPPTRRVCTAQGSQEENLQRLRAYQLTPHHTRHFPPKVTTRRPHFQPLSMPGVVLPAHKPGGLTVMGFQPPSGGNDACSRDSRDSVNEAR